MRRKGKGRGRMGKSNIKAQVVLRKQRKMRVFPRQICESPAERKSSKTSEKEYQRASAWTFLAML